MQYFLLMLDRNLPDVTEKIYSSFTNEQAKVYAGSALCRYYLDKDNISKANEVFSSIQDIQQLNIYSEGERNYTLLCLKSAMRDCKFLSENSRSLKLNSDKALLRNFFIASAYDCEGDTGKASEYYINSITSAPYIETSLAKSVEYLSKHGQQKAAYDYLIEIIQNDPTVEIQKAYFKLCLDMALVSYAESTLNDLKGKVSSSEYAEYQKKLMVIQNQ